MWYRSDHLVLQEFNDNFRVHSEISDFWWQTLLSSSKPHSLRHYWDVYWVLFLRRIRTLKQKPPFVSHLISLLSRLEILKSSYETIIRSTCIAFTNNPSFSLAILPFNLSLHTVRVKFPFLHSNNNRRTRQTAFLNETVVCAWSDTISNVWTTSNWCLNLSSDTPSTSLSY